ncbi:MAG: PIN domain-containing protein [Candidatus Micrarchaeota archaeon]|nr:PIN domain-containing protein [Candidatus Micrarchaeota archaeon]
MPIILDTSAWIELFKKSAKGAKVKLLLDSGECWTSVVTIAEITKWALRELLDPHEIVMLIEGTSQVIDTDSEIAFIAGHINYERKKTVKRWGMVDSLIAATAARHGLRILTCDRDFLGLPYAEVLEP